MKKAYRETDTHVYFYGSYLSNFRTAPFIVDLVKYNSSEQYYMAKKASLFSDWEAHSQIMQTKDPKIAKQIARGVKNFDPKIWDEFKYKVMYRGVWEKFKQNQDLQNKLMRLGDKIFVEASPTDLIWGVGLAQTDDLILDEKNWKGENLLGKVITEVSQGIRNL